MTSPSGAYASHASDVHRRLAPTRDRRRRAPIAGTSRRLAVEDARRDACEHPNARQSPQRGQSSSTSSASSGDDGPGEPPATVWLIHHRDGRNYIAWNLEREGGVTTATVIRRVRYGLGEVHRSDVQRLVDEMHAAGLAGSTVRNKLDPLRVVYRRAIQDDELVRNPAEKLRLWWRLTFPNRLSLLDVGDLWIVGERFNVRPVAPPSQAG